MKKNNTMIRFIKLLFCIIICEGAGIAGSFFTFPSIGSWYGSLNKPTISPPNWIFGPVWAILFFLMGVSLYLVWQRNWEVKNTVGFVGNKKAWNSFSQNLWSGSWQRFSIISVFIVHLFLNILWSIIFFGLHMPGLAFFEILALWFAILYTIINFYRVSKTSAFLLLPYIVWVSFAGFLNFMLWFLN